MYEFTPAPETGWSYPPTNLSPPPPDGPVPPPPPRRSRRTITIVALALACLAGGVGVGYALPHGHSPSAAAKKTPAPPHRASQSNTIDVDGTLTLTTTSLLVDDDGCSGNSGYDDITTGAEVVISDDAGRTLQITSLNVGVPDDPSLPTSCTFSFTATVPAGKGFYGVEVTHRGIVKEPESSMANVGLTLGD